MIIQWHGIVQQGPLLPGPAAGNSRHYRAEDAVFDSNNVVTALPDSISADVLRPSTHAAPVVATDQGRRVLQFTNNRLVGNVLLGSTGNSARTLLLAAKIESVGQSEIIGSTNTIAVGRISDLVVDAANRFDYYSAGSGGHSLPTDPNVKVPTVYAIMGFRVVNGLGYLIQGGYATGPNTNLNSSDGYFSVGLGAISWAGGATFKFLEAIYRHDSNPAAEAQNIAYLKAKFNIIY